MSRIAFFCIPASGHTNPTIEVVRELVNRGHEVRYYSYLTYKERIESTGAKFIACDEYDCEQKLKPEDGARVGKDMAFSIHILTDTTLALDEMVCRDMKAFHPDCIVADSMAVWGKAAALKLDIPFVSSTTTFAFNQYSARIMKQSFSQMWNMIISMPSITKDIKRLQEKGYPINNVLDIMQNDNNTDTIVYTSKEFQPCAETFSDRYSFVGPSIRRAGKAALPNGKKNVYISMGTVNNLLLKFYRSCIEAFGGSEYHVVMSVGQLTDPAQLGEIPSNFELYHSVDQIAVLQRTDVFISHCGMNSVNESLYYGVPLVMFPQTTEQGGVARRVAELGAGIPLKKGNASALRAAVKAVLAEPKYQEKAKEISESFKASGGPVKAADAILRVASRGRRKKQQNS